MIESLRAGGRPHPGLWLREEGGFHGSSGRGYPSRGTRDRNISAYFQMGEMVVALAMGDRKMARGVKAGGGAIATATATATHLDVARSYLDVLERAGVIVREPGGGYDLTKARVGFIRYLRRERTATTKTKAESAFLEQKTMALQIRNAERLGQLFPTEVANEVIDNFVAECCNEMQSLGARVAPHDLALRRRIDKAVFDVRTAISQRCYAKAKEALPVVTEEPTNADA